MGQNAEELRREIEQTRNGLGDTIEAIGDRVSPSRVMERRKNRMTGAVRTARERVMGFGSDAGHAISDRAHALTDGASSTAHGALDTTQHMPQALKGQAQGSPLAAGAIAFGIGFVAAAVFPPTRTERELAGNLTDRIEPMKQGLAEAAHDVADHLKEPAKEALEAVKETAADGAQTVKDTAREAAQDTKQQSTQAIHSA